MATERTALTPEEEAQFQSWAKANGIRDVDHPDSKYDYRGYWKSVAAKGQDQRKTYEDGPHFPDTYKQHGHPSFSVESQYSAGPWDGGRWNGESFVPWGADFMMSGGQSKLSGDDMAKAVRLLVQMLNR